MSKQLTTQNQNYPIPIHRNTNLEPGTTQIIDFVVSTETVAAQFCSAGMSLPRFIFVFIFLVIQSSLQNVQSLSLPQAAGYKFATRVTNLGKQHLGILKLRGGESEEGLTNLDKSARGSSEPSSITTNMMSAISPLTEALISLGNFYSTSLETSPILTKSATAAILFFISDQIAQTIELSRKSGRDRQKPLLALTNKKRSISSFLVGLLYFGPMAHYWYAFIFRAFPGTSMFSILQKAALGQFFFAPPLFCVFFAAALIQNGKFSLGNWYRKIKQDLVKGWLGGIGFWPIVNYISYAYIPQKWIPPFVNVMGLVFNIYVSLVANLGTNSQKREKKKA